MKTCEEFKNQILNQSLVCGISSDEVNLAKDLVNNKCKNKDIFICEGLWAADKLISKNFEITHFFFNNDKINEDKETIENLEKIAKLTKYSKKCYAISEKACKKISDREGYDEYFIIAKTSKIFTS